MSSSDLLFICDVDKFKRRKYPAHDMATIMKAIAAIGARPLKPGSSGAKEVRGRVERLSKDSTPKGSGKEAPRNLRRRRRLGVRKMSPRNPTIRRGWFTSPALSRSSRHQCPILAR